jgi:hypothetical protein
MLLLLVLTVNAIDVPMVLLAALLVSRCLTVLLGSQAVCQPTAGVHGIWPRVHWVAEVKHGDVQVLASIAEHLAAGQAGNVHSRTVF